ncbi:hypothetical protein LY76DRAFT_132856 [Colletotrichum caudatum]|nr:hypothetical protein LY76DRAFT_132856 [Colletotrichum caudatum]
MLVTVHLWLPPVLPCDLTCVPLAQDCSMATWTVCGLGPGVHLTGQTSRLTGSSKVQVPPIALMSGSHVGDNRGDHVKRGPPPPPWRAGRRKKQGGGGWDIASVLSPLPRDLHGSQKRMEEMRKERCCHVAWDSVKRLAADPDDKKMRRFAP